VWAGVPIPDIASPGRQFSRRGAAPWRAAASGCCMVDTGGSGPVMAVSGQMRRTYHAGPLTLGVSLRPRRDNRENFIPWAWGQEQANKSPRKQRGGLQDLIYAG